MKHCTALFWGLVVVLALPMVLHAEGRFDDRDRHGDRDHVRVVTQDADSPDENRAYRQWFGHQMGSYNTVDPVTGERLSDLLQLVTDVDRTSITVSGQDRIRRAVAITAQTAVTPFRQSAPSDRSRPMDAARLLCAGDLVIVNGYLRANGDFVASSIRVMGRAWGGGSVATAPNYGQRAWGTVRNIDYRYGRITVDTNAGISTITLARGGDVLCNKQAQTIAYLRRGDRIIFYYRDTDRYPLEAYRIVILRGGEAYPEKDKPCCTDPDYRDDAQGKVKGPELDGRLELVSTGVLFNKLTLRTNAGQQVSVYLPKTLEVQDSQGRTISLYTLRQNEHLRVSYTDVAGTLFAQQVSIW